jgi:hypothetical protein
MHMIIGTWNVRSLYRSGSFKAVSTELAKYKSHFMEVQQVRWLTLDQQTIIHSSMEMRMLIIT